MDSVQTDGGLTRRKVLVAGTGTVLGASLLAACGDDGESGTSPTAGSSASGDVGGALAKVADIPVGGAVSATTSDGKPALVAQPTKGRVVAFSAICTHQGCTVAPGDQMFKCPCHGSTYDLATGDNTGGPAPRPLTEISVKVEGGEVVEA